MLNFLKKKKLDNELLEKIEEELILADIGIEATSDIIDNLKRNKFNQDITVDEVKSFILKYCENTLQNYSKKLTINTAPFVIFVSGTNGSGKTTTIAKLANLLSKTNEKILLVAGDTFRSGAIEQIKTWGEKLSIDVFASTEIKDPAALAYKAYEKAINENYNVLIVDTSGRLSNNTNLMQELKKIETVIKKLNPNAPHESILVLDGTIGQSSLYLAEGFKKTINITSLIVTKLDGSSKGGAIIPLVQKLKLPILFLGIGENHKDLIPFSSKEFSKHVLNLK